MVKPLPKQSSTSGPENCQIKSRQFKGIRLRKWGKWVSEIRMPNSRAKIWLGSYDSPEKAARAYDFAVYCLRGSKATFNFPDSPPEIPCASALSPPQIRMPNSRAKIWLGSYDSPEKAARAYDFAVYCLRGSKATFNFPDSPPEIPCASALSPPQIQAAAARFATEDFRLPSEEDAASSCSSPSEAESGIDSQQISAEQCATFWDSLLLEDLDSGESLNLEDFPPLDFSMDDFGFLFEQTKDWGLF